MASAVARSYNNIFIRNRVQSTTEKKNNTKLGTNERSLQIYNYNNNVVQG